MDHSRNFSLIFSLCFFFISFLYGQKNDCAEEALAYHEKLNAEFLDPEESPLDSADRLVFAGIDFFDFNEKYCVEADFFPSDNSDTIRIPTSSSKIKEFYKYGELHFILDGKELSLSIYRNFKLMKTEEYKNNLFIPFKDLTNGKETYGGGRYLDLEHPLPNKIKLDFNQCYNPYCAYSMGWNCPIPPVENHLEIEIKAGVKSWGH